MEQYLQSRSQAADAIHHEYINEPGHPQFLRANQESLTVNSLWSNQSNIQQDNNELRKPYRA